MPARCQILLLAAMLLAPMACSFSGDPANIPPAPISLGATPMAGGVLLSWKPGSLAPVDAYRIFQGLRHGGCADRTQQRFLSFAVQSKQYVEAVIEYGYGVIAVRRIFILFRPLAERTDSGAERGLLLFFVIVSIVCEHSQQANHR